MFDKCPNCNHRIKVNLKDDFSCGKCKLRYVPCLDCGAWRPEDFCETCCPEAYEALNDPDVKQIVEAKIKRALGLKDKQARQEKIELVESVPILTGCNDPECEGMILENFEDWQIDKLNQLKNYEN